MKMPIRVLIVDDDRRVLSVLGRALGRLENQFEVLTAGGGGEALERIRGGSIEVVVTDIVMDGLGGIELTETIRRERREIVVIWMTAHGCARFQSDRERLGVMECLDKPVSVADFRRRVCEAIGLVGG
jgi:DNA-binding NtrC family response regulator